MDAEKLDFIDGRSQSSINLVHKYPLDKVFINYKILGQDYIMTEEILRY